MRAPSLLFLLFFSPDFHRHGVGRFLSQTFSIKRIITIDVMACIRVKAVGREDAQNQEAGNLNSPNSYNIRWNIRMLYSGTVVKGKLPYLVFVAVYLGFLSGEFVYDKKKGKYLFKYFSYSINLKQKTNAGGCYWRCW